MDILDADAPTEADSERDGLLSYAGEWHALEVGLLAGFTTAYTGKLELAAIFAGIVLGGRKLGVAHLQDARKEAGYAGAAFVAGALLGTALAVLT